MQYPCLFYPVLSKHVLIFSTLRYVLVINGLAKPYITPIQLMPDCITRTGRQTTKLFDLGAYFIKLLLVMIVYYTAWELFWCSPHIYILAFLLSANAFRHSDSFFRSCSSPSFNSLSFHVYLPYFIYCSSLSTRSFSKMNTSAQHPSESQRSMSDAIGRAVQVNALSLDHYLHKKMYARVDRIADPNNLLCIIDRAHCRALAQSLGNYNYD